MGQAPIDPQGQANLARMSGTPIIREIGNAKTNAERQFTFAGRVGDLSACTRSCPDKHEEK
jgi:hypothetical protein